MTQRRAAVRDEALRHALELMTREGVGALSVSEVARRMGIRGPSLYKYFPSRHAMYDALFARGLAAESDAVRGAVDDLAHGVPRLRAGGVAFVRWAVENPTLAQLLHWRVVPGFEPSPETFGPSVAAMAELREEFRQAVALGQLSSTADSDDAVRIWTCVIGGLATQQLANQPGLPFEKGDFSRLTETAIDLFLSAYRP